VYPSFWHIRGSSFPSAQMVPFYSRQWQRTGGASYCSCRGRPLYEDMLSPRDYRSDVTLNKKKIPVWYHFSHCGGAGRGERRELGRLVIHEHQNNERRHIAGFWLKCKRDCALVEQSLAWTLAWTHLARRLRRDLSRCPAVLLYSHSCITTQL